MSSFSQFERSGQAEVWTDPWFNFLLTDPAVITAANHRLADQSESGESKYLMAIARRIADLGVYDIPLEDLAIQAEFMAKRSQNNESEQDD